MLEINKRKQSFLVGLLVFLCSWMIIGTGQAEMPLWTFEPLTPTTVTVPSNGTATVQYRITNNSTKSKNLILDTRPENTPVGISASPCQLTTKGSSCTFVVTINGSAIPQTGIHQGPVVCKQSNTHQCYHPSANNILHITRGAPVPNGLSISVTGSPLILFPAYPTLSGTTRTLTVTNNSLTTTATNVSATLPADWNDVTQDASDCLSIAPGASCQLAFTPGTATHEAITAPVSGSNTNIVNTSLSVNYLWLTNSDVLAVQLDPANNVLYLGGTFTYVGPYTGYGVPLDENSGQPLANFPRVNGTIHAVIPDDTGGWYIGGGFTQVGDVTRNRIAHILSDYTVDQQFNPNANNTVHALALNGSTVYTGGNFTSIGGQTRNRIATLDSASGLATAWNPNANSIVYSLALNGSTVYAGGDFFSIGGQTRNSIAALDSASGLATAWNPGANKTVRALALNGSTVYAGGDLASSGGQTRNRIAALDLSTGIPTAWNPGANGVVYALSLNGSTVYAGGNFTSIGGQIRNNIAALDAATGLATAWNPDANRSVLAFALNGSTVYAGGNFSTIGGAPSGGVAILPE